MNSEKLRKLVFTAMLAAVAGALMSLEFSIPLMPVFYKIDFSDVPTIIATLSMGPLAGAAVEILKLLIKLVTVGTNTMFVGEFANLISIIFFVYPIWIVYNKMGKNLKAAVIALGLSVVIRTAIACFINAYITLPMYAGAMGMSIDDVVRAVSFRNPSVQNLRTFIMFATIPFNLIKNGLNSAIGYVLYDRIKNIKRFSDVLK